MQSVFERLTKLIASKNNFCEEVFVIILAAMGYKRCADALSSRFPPDGRVFYPR